MAFQAQYLWQQQQSRCELSFVTATDGASVYVCAFLHVLGMCLACVLPQSQYTGVA